MVITKYTNCRFFDGESITSSTSFCVGDGVIVEANSDEVTHEINLNGRLVAPGFIDIQVNGGGGVLFNSEPTVEGIQSIVNAHRQFGTTSILPTFITDDIEGMKKAVKAAQTALENNTPGVIGLHLEGPVLNTIKKGTHDANKFKQLDAELLALFKSFTAGPLLITLAPALVAPDIIKELSAIPNVTVFAGHTNADYDETIIALQNGIKGFTHLFNAMTQLGSRAPGMVGAAIQDEHSYVGIIADGHHVHPACIDITVKAKPKGKVVLVTDAMPTVGSETPYFKLNDEVIYANEGKLINAEGSLAGSDLNMNQAVTNCINYTNCELTEAIRMASLYPAELLGLSNKLGYLKPGYQANFVVLDSNNVVTNTAINGEFI